jgi:hypothetical protein
LLYQEEKIELTKDSIRIIMENEYLGRLRLKGGRNTRKRKSKKDNKNKV